MLFEWNSSVEIVSDVAPISARLISNKASYKFKTEEINKIVTKFSEEIKK